jgi:uncharacterized repeat protein (TIGR01451 family)
MINRIASVLAMWTLLLWATQAFAAEPNQVDVALHAFQVAAQDKLVPATEARPGDVIEYQVTYHNTSKAAAKHVDATLPVPPGGLAYLEGSAKPATLLASVDGKQFAAPPLKREVKRDGRTVIETIPPAEYRFLRWSLGDLAAGQSVTVSARMRLAEVAQK